MLKSIITATISLIIALCYNTAELIPGRLELTFTEPALVLGLDKSDDGDGVTVSVLLNSFRDTGEAEGEEHFEKEVLSAAAQTIAMAAEQVKSSAAKSIANGNNKYFIIGDGAQRDGINKYIDYLSRNNELRLSSEIYFTRGGSAKEAINLIDGNFAADTELFAENSGITGFTSKMTFGEFLQNYCDDLPHFAVPLINVEEAAIKTGGYAIVSNGHFIGCIDRMSARGYNYITNKKTHSTVEIYTNEGTAVALAVGSVKTKIKFIFNGDELTKIILQTHCTADIHDTQGVGNLTDKTLLTEYGDKMNYLISNEMRTAVNIAKSNKCDFLEIGKSLSKKHPYKWEGLKNNWNDTFANTPIEIEVKCNVEKTYALINNN